MRQSARAALLSELYTNFLLLWQQLSCEGRNGMQAEPWVVAERARPDEGVLATAVVHGSHDSDDLSLPGISQQALEMLDGLGVSLRPCEL